MCCWAVRWVSSNSDGIDLSYNCTFAVCSKKNSIAERIVFALKYALTELNVIISFVSVNRFKAKTNYYCNSSRWKNLTYQICRENVLQSMPSTQFVGQTFFVLKYYFYVICISSIRHLIKSLHKRMYLVVFMCF